MTESVKCALRNVPLRVPMLQQGGATFLSGECLNPVLPEVKGMDDSVD